MRISRNSVIRLLFVIVLVSICPSLHSAQAILQPQQDVIVITFGGGEGCNVFAKYDITSVPGGMVIDSVFFTGGECTLQMQALLNLTRFCKDLNRKLLSPW